MERTVTHANVREAETVFNVASQFAPEERPAYLDRVCAGQPQVRARVEALLRAHDKLGQFLPDRLTALPADLVEGQAIGRYKLLEKIGEGGCGVVYLAEQQEPVRRHVALKVIKLGMDTKAVIARFEAERQALAMMDHPNIARVLDGGATETGRLYLVMELVRGIPITKYCDENHLSADDRIKLFILVCQAIQHAHQKGIIHRDIKPSNILVTLHDGLPIPRVIDFGIAKATEGRLTEATVHTHLLQFVGTPAYMSPEQAELRPDRAGDIDTRSDIYSLGVLLYELLTGQTPFDSQELIASGIDEMRKTIREKEPVRPSARLTQELVGVDVRRLTLSGLPTTGSQSDSRVSSRRLLQIKEALRVISSDLDWVVMKCLEKERSRRYESASGLAADLKRFLADEPVLARPPSVAYRFQKTIRRNKVAFAAASAVALTLIAGLSFSTRAFLREAAQRRTAERNALQARQAERKAESAAATMARNLYFAQMNLAGNAAAEQGGISRIADLTAKWIPKAGETDLRGWEWHYLRSLLHQDLFTLVGHTADVSSVAWSPDGKRVASASHDQTIRIWDAATRKLTLTLLGHSLGVASVAWSPDGRRLASGSHDHTVKVWDAGTGTNLLTFTGHVAPVRSVAWNRDGIRLASGSEDKSVRIWDTENGQNILNTFEHTNQILSVAWTADGRHLASGSSGGAIKIWDVDHGSSVRTIEELTYWVNSVSWNPDGKRLASDGGIFEVHVWDAFGGTKLNTLAGHWDAIDSIAWSPDGASLASGSEDNTVKVWDALNGNNLFTHRGHSGYVFSVAWSPDGQYLASGSQDKTVKIWRTVSEEALTFQAHTDKVHAVAWRPDGKLVASASFDNTVRIWNPESGQELFALGGHANAMTAVAWSPDGRSLVSGSPNRTIKIWDTTTGRTNLTLPNHAAIIAAVSWSPDGQRLALGNGDHDTINLYESATGQWQRALPGHTYAVHSIAWSPDGRLLASGSWDRSVRVWDVASGKVIHDLRDPRSGGYTVVAFSPDGTQLAAAAFNKTVKIWEVPSGTAIHTLGGHSAGVLSVSWSPDGTRLASSSMDGTIKVWDPASGNEALTLRGHKGAVQSVAWSPDGQRLLSGSYDHTARIWDARKGFTNANN